MGRIFRDSGIEKIHSTEANNQSLRTDKIGSPKDSQGHRALAKLETGEKLTDPGEIMAAVKEAARRSYTDVGKMSKIETSRQAFQRSRQELTTHLDQWQHSTNETQLVFNSLDQTEKIAKEYKTCYKDDIAKKNAKEYRKAL